MTIMTILATSSEFSEFSLILITGALLIKRWHHLRVFSSAAARRSCFPSWVWWRFQWFQTCSWSDKQDEPPTSSHMILSWPCNLLQGINNANMVYYWNINVLVRYVIRGKRRSMNLPMELDASWPDRCHMTCQTTCYLSRCRSVSYASWLWPCAPDHAIDQSVEVLGCSLLPIG